MKRIIITTLAALLLTAGSALADKTLQDPTTGHKAGPTNTCGPGLPTPGNAVNAKGSPFNPGGTAGTVYAGNPDTASLAHSNSTATVSQYDNACLQIP
jgi:hypothetical protein